MTTLELQPIPIRIDIGEAAVERAERRVKRCERCCLYLFEIPIACFTISWIILQLSFTPGPPRYTVSGISFSAANTTVVVSVHNPHKHLGLSFRQKYSQISVSRNNVVVAEGVFPAFHLPPRTPKLINLSLTGARVPDLPHNVMLMPPSADQSYMPLDFHTRVPIAYKLGHLKILWNYWTIHKVPFKVTI